IQAAFIPRALTGVDVIGQAQTGTGKTAAFLLPFYQNWKDRGVPGPEAIILCPTRELCVQVAEESQKLAPSKHCRTVAIYGAQRYQRNPLHINLSPERPTVSSIRQHYITVDKERKFELLLRLALRERPRQCIIFCERKIGAHRLYEKLHGRLPRVGVMHGDLP